MFVVKSRPFSVIIWLICFWRPDCNFQRGVLRTFCPTFCLYSCWIWFWEIVLERRASFLYYEKLREILLRSVQMQCCRSRHSLLYFSFLCLLNANCNFQKRGLQDFVQHSVYSCWSCFHNHFCTISKRLIGSVPIGEGPGDVAQWRGWTPLSTYVCDSLILCFYSIYVHQCCCFFHSYSEHLISINVVPLINLLNAFFYNKLLMHSSCDPMDHIMVSELVDYLCNFVNAY